MQIAIRFIGVILLGLLLLVGVTSCGVIETGNVGVRTTLGKVSADEVDPGVYLGLPAVSRVDVFSAKEIGIDLNDSKFPLAKELGCTRTISALDPKLVETVKDWTRGGVDFSFEISGSKAAMASAYNITRKGGEIVCVGMGASADLYQYQHTSLVAEEKVFRGSLMGSCVPQRDLPLYMKYYQEGRLPVDRLMTGTFKFDELNHNLDLLEHGAVLRQVLLPHA